MDGSSNQSSSRAVTRLSGIRERDWSKTPLGDPSDRPQPLKTTVRLMLATQHPVFVFWGRDLTCFYNDAYRQSLGSDGLPQTCDCRVEAASRRSCGTCNASLNGRQRTADGLEGLAFRRNAPDCRRNRCEQHEKATEQIP